MEEVGRSEVRPDGWIHAVYHHYCSSTANVYIICPELPLCPSLADLA